MITLSEFLSKEWVPAFGCTEPASIALAVSTATRGLGPIKKITVTVDPKIYKNCHAVGIPNSQHKTGILWTVAIGAEISAECSDLEIFSFANEKTIQRAEKLIAEGCISIDIDKSKDNLFISCVAECESGTGKTVIEGEHTNFTLIEKTPRKGHPLPSPLPSRERGYIEQNGKIIFRSKEKSSSQVSEIRKQISDLSISQMIDIAKNATIDELQVLKTGIEMNIKMAEHGLKLFPKHFVEIGSKDHLGKMATLVCAGVYARMWGEELPVMTLAGSGNKGIVASVPLHIYGTIQNKPEEEILRALALACLLTSAITHHLGTLSAVCGCSNSAGIGLSAGFVWLMGGGEKEISLAINNMVGNVSGMICDGAKIGCALKTMTSTDAAFRSATLAMEGLGIPPSDGIVGKNGRESLKNLGRLSKEGFSRTDETIIEIMQKKLK